MSDLPLPEPVPTDQALDIQHDTDPADERGNARRIPNLGHALIFFALMLGSIVLCVTIVLATLHISTPKGATEHPIGSAIAEVLGYALTFAIAVPLFRMVWRRPFLEGISWNGRAARLRWWQLLLFGCALSIVAELLLSLLVKTPSTSDISKLLTTPLTAWITVVVGSFTAPVVEEIGFRGFLLPALATAYDWLSLDRTPIGRDRWQRTSNHTPGGLVFGALLSSVAFAGLHGMQLHWATWPLVNIFLVAIVLAAVRIKFRSVAASVLVHFAYDALLFLQIVVVTHGFHHLDKM